MTSRGTSFCQYKNIFGKPGEGIHSYRIFNIAIFDLLGTILVAILIAYLTKTNVWLVFFILFLIGILLHYLFCVDTTVNKFLSGK